MPITNISAAERRSVAAKRLGISLATLDRLVLAGHLRKTKLGRATLIPSADVDRLLTRGVISVTEQQP